MVEVDPVILIAAGTAIVGFATVIACTRKSNSDTNIPSETEKIVNISKSKKKSKPSKAKSSNSNEVRNDEASTETSISKTNTENGKIIIEPINVPSNIVETDNIISEEINNTSEDMNKKSKKAKETPEQKASRLERQKSLKAVTKTTEKEKTVPSSSISSIPSSGTGAISSSTENTSANSTTPVFDGWAVVEDKRKFKGKKTDIDGIEEISMVATPPSSSEPVIEVSNVIENGNTKSIEAPIVPTEVVPVKALSTSKITVESRKLGLLIGPKGVTKIGLQIATGTEITMPKVEKDFSGPVEIAVTGPAEGVDTAIHALNELVSKGYCNLLADPDFYEGYVAVHPRYLPDIIGKGGICIKAIQNFTGVKITTPTGFTKTTPAGETIVPSKVKIGLAGHREKVSIARNLILDLTKYYHTPVTHPGIIHVEMDIPSHYYNYIIGSKGSEIKHIQANYKVTVFIPSSESINENVLILGHEDAVKNAEKHIHKIMEKVDIQSAERAKAEAEGIALGENAKAKLANNNAAAAAANNAPSTKDYDRKPRIEKEEPEEEWVKDFAPRQRSLPLGSLLPLTAKFTTAAVPTSVTIAENTTVVSSQVNNTVIVEPTSIPLNTTSTWGGKASLPTETW